MKLDAIIKDIYKLIAQCNQTDNINDLITNNLRLAGYLFYLSKNENEAHKSYLEAYNERKYQTALLTSQGNGSATDRATKAEIEIKEYRQKETDAETYYNMLRNIKNDTKEFIGVVVQKISILKIEQNLVKKDV
jgi:hypothetical protein